MVLRCGLDPLCKATSFMTCQSAQIVEKHQPPEHAANCGRTFALRINALTPRILEGARQAHSVQDGDAPRKRAINSLGVVIDV